MSALRRPTVLLLVLLAVMSCVYLDRLPGLFGDEGSEGQNVYELLTGGSLITVFGERSYIGPLVDYVRVPFIGLLGYTPFGLRMPMVIISLSTFMLLLQALRKLVGTNLALFVASFLFFSPIYLTYQRLGWAVTLFPFFIALTLYLIVSWQGRHKWLLVGLAAGLGLAQYITWFPSLMALIVGLVLYHTGPKLFTSNPRTWLHDIRQTIAITWPGLIGFWAGFGTQFGVLNMYKEDHGDPAAVAALFWERLADLPVALPQVLSGAVYAASYGAPPFPAGIVSTAVILLGILALAALVLSPHRWLAWVWLIALIVQVTVLLVMVDRFALRYFVVFALGIWALSGLGLGKIVLRVAPNRMPTVAVATAVVLSLITATSVFYPVLTGNGAFTRFALDGGDSWSETKVDLRPLLSCLEGKTNLYSDDIHIRNRFLFLQHDVLSGSPSTGKADAEWLVRLRAPGRAPGANEVCPELKNFTVVPFSAS